MLSPWRSWGHPQSLLIVHLFTRNAQHDKMSCCKDAGVDDFDDTIHFSNRFKPYQTNTPHSLHDNDDYKYKRENGRPLLLLRAAAVADNAALVMSA